MQVRCPNAITRKLISSPRKLIYPAMEPSGEIDSHSVSGYRKMTGDSEDEEKGYGIRGLNVLRRGKSRSTGAPVVHLIECVCKSHRLRVRSSYAAECLAAAHNVDDCWPTLVTLHELTSGILTPTPLRDLREKSGIIIMGVSDNRC